MYTKVYMSNETNAKMFLGEEVEGSLLPRAGDIEIIVGNYRITKLNYPVVLVKPAS